MIFWQYGILIIAIVQYSNALNCYTGGSGLDCSKAESCYITSYKGKAEVGCTAEYNCSNIVTKYPVKDGYTLFCCNTDNCNVYKEQNNNITCYDSSTNSSTCQATGACFKIDDALGSHKGCSALSCDSLIGFYSNKLGLKPTCCTYNYCNSVSKAIASLYPTILILIVGLLTHYISL